ncbi:sigma-70 family RNA polymerase sigma factor [Nocardia salmonicida]|uniref:hypothetical protein n=1 Tax=Nocardia salmonicida TaxID=53431 RepID=UPI0007A473B5|nr:hypothetical protein [Nocardia salmonicida]
MTQHSISSHTTDATDWTDLPSNIATWIDRVMLAQRVVRETGEADPVTEYVVRALLVSKAGWVMDLARRSPLHSVRAALTDQAQLYRDAAYGLATRPVASDGSEPVLNKANNLRSAAIRIDAIVRALDLELGSRF